MNRETEVTENAFRELGRVARTLPGNVRRILAQEWSQAAQFEHASIASFSRFSLELLAVGAPADLVASAHRAALDEVRHARLCFGLASAYAGAALGPGPLPLGPQLFRGSELAEITEAAVMEGCVGETLAALSAERALARAEPPAVRAVLQIVAEDESEHAALAFRFVAWAVRVGGHCVSARVRPAFTNAIARCRTETARSSLADSELARHGRLSGGERRELVEDAIANVLAPAIEELFDERTASGF